MADLNRPVDPHGPTTPIPPPVKEADPNETVGAASVPTMISGGTQPTMKFSKSVFGLTIKSDVQVELGASSGPAQLPTLAERYINFEDLGHGGFGVVKKAWDLKMARPVVFKIFMGDVKKQNELESFLREPRIVSKLDHPSILQPIDADFTPDVWWRDFGIQAGRLFVTMELIEGETLHEILATEPFDLHRRLQRFFEIVDAVACAHSSGILHRDLKPDNVKIKRSTGRPYLLDWGLAWDTAFEDPYRCRVAGTPGYISPEMARGESTDERTDVYALGVILFQSLTNRLPFELGNCQSIQEVLERTVLEDPPLLRSIRSDLPEALEAITATALARDLEERYKTASELSKALQSYFDGSARKEKAEQWMVKARKTDGLLQELEDLQKSHTTMITELDRQIPGWKPIEDRRPIQKLKKRLKTWKKMTRNGRQKLSESLIQALSAWSECPEARAMLADYWIREFLEHEAKGDFEQRDKDEPFVKAYDEGIGRFTALLKGDGVLELDSSPSGAEVELCKYHEIDNQEVAQLTELRGLKTPFKIPLPMGSYFAILKYDGFREVRYPIFISRQKEWSGMAKMYSEDQIGSEFIYVPGGQFLAGENLEPNRPVSPGAKAREVMEVGDFFIARNPVTCGEYLEFLNALVASGTAIEEVLKRAPRTNEGPLWNIVGGKFHPELKASWQMLQPVTNVSWHDANAYCAWRSTRDGITYSLPTEWEYEKAAGGVDGRRFPWGNAEEASFANCWDAFPSGQARLVTISEFPEADTSVYGVRGCSGGVSDFTDTLDSGDTKQVMVRGGRWRYPVKMSTARIRTILARDVVTDVHGFRLIHRPR